MKLFPTFALINLKHQINTLIGCLSRHSGIGELLYKAWCTALIIIPAVASAPVPSF